MDKIVRFTFIISISGLCLLSLGCRFTNEDANTMKVYILAGQSNAVGYNEINTHHPAPLPDSLKWQSDVLFWPGSNAVDSLANGWTALQSGVSEAGQNAFGPELSFANIIKRQTNNKIAILKYAVGGTGIARSKDYTEYIPGFETFNDQGKNWHPPHNGQSGGLLYQNLINNISTALDRLDQKDIKYEVTGLLWMQGEHESGLSEGMADDYPRLLNTFIYCFRRDIGIYDLPVVIGQISDKWLYAAKVQEAQSNFCRHDLFSRLVITNDLPRKVGDDAHYTANGTVELGNRFAIQMQQLQAELKEME